MWAMMFSCRIPMLETSKGLICVAAMLIAGCAQQTEVVKLYDNTAAQDRQYEKFFVVGLAGDSDTRRRLEDLITGQLRAAGAGAVPGYTETGPQTTLLQDEINEAARRSGSDAILVTHIVSVDTTADKQTGRVDILSECRGGDPADYFLYDYDELKEPDTVRLAHTVVAVTNLYDAGAGERVWSIQSTCFDKATMPEVFLEEAEAIARQLVTDNLIG